MTATGSSRTTAADITAAAVASFDGCADGRLRELMQSLVRHVHAFAVETSLTEEEWRQLIAVLTDTGNITDERRQEFIRGRTRSACRCWSTRSRTSFPPGQPSRPCWVRSTCPLRRCASTVRAW